MRRSAREIACVLLKNPSFISLHIRQKTHGEMHSKEEETKPREAYRKALHSTHCFLEQIRAALLGTAALGPFSA